jgi:DNA invertase Pin-like site-specific DNA recombinase
LDGYGTALREGLVQGGLADFQSGGSTTTPGGRLIFHVFGTLGQFERDLIRERTRAGLSAAAARGRKGGRKQVVTPDKLERAKALMGQGLNVRRQKSAQSLTPAVRSRFIFQCHHRQERQRP